MKTLFSSQAATLVWSSLFVWTLVQSRAIDDSKKVPSSKQEQTEGDPSSSTWAKLQISPDTLCSLKYANFRVTVYEHSDNKKSTTPNRNKKYFYVPVAMLDHQSASSSFNSVLNQAEMRFRIDMWNEDVENSVISYVSKVVGEEVKPHQVQVMPLEKVILASTAPSAVYSLSNNWLPYQQQEYLWFIITCVDNIKCQNLAEVMRTRPEEFHHFKLLFSMSSQSTQTKQTVIRIQSVVNGNMVSKLLQKYQNEKEVLLTAQDEKQLLSETMTNVLIESFDDSDVISQSSETQIYKILQDMLVSSRTTIKDQSSTMWNSVFWNEDNYRPDKTSKLLTDAYKKLDKTNQTRLTDYFKNGTKVGVELGVSLFGLFNIKGGVNYENTKEGMNSRDNVENALAEMKNNVDWDGQKFVPKPLSLSRINLAKLRDSQSLQDKKVNIRYTTAVLSTPINILDNSTSSRLPPVERKRITDLYETLDDKIYNLDMKFTGKIYYY